MLKLIDAVYDELEDARMNEKMKLQNLAIIFIALLIHTYCCKSRQSINFVQVNISCIPVNKEIYTA